MFENYQKEIHQAREHADLKKIGRKMYDDTALKADNILLSKVIYVYKAQQSKLDQQFATTSSNKDFKSQLYYINTMFKSEKNLKLQLARVGKTLHALTSKGLFSSVEAEILFRAYQYQKRKLIREGKLEAQLPMTSR